MPQVFQDGDKGSQIEEAIGSLENLTMPNVPECVADMDIFYLPPERIISRPARRDDAVRRLRTVVEAINEHLQEDPDSDDAKEMEDFAGELEDAISEAENVEFPGMYG